MIMVMIIVIIIILTFSAGADASVLLLIQEKISDFNFKGKKSIKYTQRAYVP